MATRLRQPLTITGGTGVTASNSGVQYFGTEQVQQEISIGNDISTTGNVQFNQVTSSLNLGGASYSDSGIVNGTVNITNAGVGTTKVTSNFFVTGSVTSSGLSYDSLTADSQTGGTTYLSGSNIFGDDITDKQYFSGSVSMTGSFSLNGYEVDEITNDTGLTDQSSTGLATESGSKVYADDNISATVVEPYLRKNFNKNASSITNNTASFTAVTASAPDGITSTSESDFLFWNNGQIMEHDALTIQQSGSTFLLIVDGSSLGYNLETNDEIKAWGKFDG